MFRRLGRWLGIATAMVLASPLLAMAQTAGSAGGGDGLRAGLIGLGAGIGFGVRCALPGRVSGLLHWPGQGGLGPPHR